MTLEELLAREAIRKTIADYTVAGDRLDQGAFMACFTADAVLETDGIAPPDDFRFDGPDAIRRWISRWREQASSAVSPHRASFVRHHLTTCAIELTGEHTAKARTYWSAWTDIGPDHAGHYLDHFRKEGELWLIAHRRIRRDWQAPNSLFREAVARTR